MAQSELVICPHCGLPFLVGTYAYRLAMRFCSADCIISYINKPGLLSYTQLSLPFL
jgi:hypothetical protein